MAKGCCGNGSKVVLSASAAATFGHLKMALLMHLPWHCWCLSGCWVGGVREREGKRCQIQYQSCMPAPNSVGNKYTVLNFPGQTQSFGPENLRRHSILAPFRQNGTFPSSLSPPQASPTEIHPGLLRPALIVVVFICRLSAFLNEIQGGF